MRGVSKMKKLTNILRLLLYFGLGYLLFNVVVSITEFVFLIILSNGKIEFWGLLLKGFKENLKVYTIIYFIIFVLNLLYNLISIKILNAKLNKIKKKG